MPLTKKEFAIAILICAILGMGWVKVITSPPYTFHPLCTYDLIHRVETTIDVDGMRYRAAATSQNTFSRNWIAPINSAGCPQTYGTALAFQLTDGRVVLVRTGICRKAKEVLADFAPTDTWHYHPIFTTAMQQRRAVDVKRYCAGLIWDTAGLGRICGRQWRPSEPVGTIQLRRVTEELFRHDPSGLRLGICHRGNAGRRHCPRGARPAGHAIPHSQQH